MYYTYSTVQYELWAPHHVPLQHLCSLGQRLLIFTNHCSYYCTCTTVVAVECGEPVSTTGHHYWHTPPFIIEITVDKLIIFILHDIWHMYLHYSRLERVVTSKYCHYKIHQNIIYIHIYIHIYSVVQEIKSVSSFCFIIFYLKNNNICKSK